MSEQPKVGRYLIYGLLDPRDDSLCYIGKTHKRREIRLQEHIEAAINGSQLPVHEWIRDVVKSGFEPVVFVLKRISPEKCWRQAEKAEISRWRAFDG